MKTILLTIVCNLIWTCTVFGQLSKIDLNGLDHRAHEFSGLAHKGDILYLLSESCKKVFTASMGKSQITGSVSLSDFPDNIDLEGVCVYGQYLFVTDERKNTIRAWNMMTSKEMKVSFDTKWNIPQNKSLSLGLEGISILPGKNKLFVVREKNKDGKGELYSLDFKIKANTLHLSSTGSPQLMDFGNTKKRVCGMDVSGDGKYMYLLITKIGNYEIWRYPIKNDKVDIKNSDVVLRFDLTIGVKSHENKYHTNIEGITVLNHDIYLISDNAQTDDTNCKLLGSSDKKTLLLKFTY